MANYNEGVKESELTMENSKYASVGTMQTKGKEEKESKKVYGALKKFRVKNDLQMRVNVKPHLCSPRVFTIISC